MNNLPENNLILQKSKSTEDVQSLSIVHNQNADTIANYINMIKAYISSLEFTSTITQEQFNQLLIASKNSTIISVLLETNDFIEFNGYRLTKIGTPTGSTTGVEYVITDTNIIRNTNFRNTVIIVRTFSGQTIYPVIKGTLTSASIIFGSALDVSPTIADASIDPNNKRIIIF